jgi:multidrug resistance efflux pump
MYQQLKTLETTVETLVASQKKLVLQSNHAAQQVARERGRYTDRQKDRQRYAGGFAEEGFP